MDSQVLLEVSNLRAALMPLTWNQVEELKKKAEELGSSVAETPNAKDAVDGFLVIAEALQKEIEHQIWVQSRDASDELAETLVPQIPDHIILNLSKATMHNGAPRVLLGTKAFQDRLASLS